MTMIRWSPLLSSPSRYTDDVHNEVGRLLDGFLTRSFRSDAAPAFSPAIDIEETPEEYVVRADLPGVQSKDVKVTVLGDTLTIRGERTVEKDQKDRNFHRVERSAGSFERSFTFGTAVRNEAVKAQVRDGVLEVRVPKAEDSKTREINVQIG